MTRSSILRYSLSDSYLIGLSLVHPFIIWLFPSFLTVGLGIWWNSNTISHHFLHLPFFRPARLNRAYSLYLTVLLGIPQSFWKERHLAHHRGDEIKGVASTAFWIEGLLVLLVWTLLGLLSPGFFFFAYLPGYVLGLTLCFLHGYFEHVRGTTSNYGMIYNMAFFNDGYHVEHHRRPNAHWSVMPGLRRTATHRSEWPAVLRWIDLLTLETLETLAIRFRPLQSLLLRTHEKAFRKLGPLLPPISNIVVIGGGMFPRTALVLLKLFPDAKVRILDSETSHLEIARRFLDHDNVQFEHCHYELERVEDCDLLVLPLSFQGSKEEAYREPPAASVIIHDWIWSRRGKSVIVSLLLMKRMNLILR